MDSDKMWTHHSTGQIKHGHNSQHIPAPAVASLILTLSVAVGALQAVGNGIKQQWPSFLTITIGIDITFTQICNFLTTAKTSNLTRLNNSLTGKL